MKLEIGTAGATSGGGAAGLALAPARRAALARKDVALLTSFVIGFVVIAFFAAVLVLTESREDRFGSGSGAGAESPAGGR